MLSDTSILQTLNDLDTNFNLAVPPLDNFYAKLAVLEVCGWIEEAIDEIWWNIFKYKIKNIAHQEIVEKAINENSAFDYERNFKKVLVLLIGTKKIEELEKKVDPYKFQNLKSELGNLKKVRNSAAHTHFQIGVTPNFDAPSITLKRVQRVYDGLENIESVLLRLRLTKI